MKKTISIIKQIELDQGKGIFIIEIFNNAEGEYDYYITGFRYPLQHVFGVPVDNRFTKKDIMQLYHNGYFDQFITEIIGN